jgi:NADH-quinone oxidoreductase subunit N
MNWTLLSPELFFLTAALVFLGISMSGRPDPERDYLTAVVLGAVGLGICLACVPLRGDLFLGAYRVDLFSQTFKTLLAMGFFLIVCICNDLTGVAERHHPEFYLLLTASTLALMLLVSCVHLLPLYVALELSSYSLYVLVYLQVDLRQGIRAGLTYFLIGAAASAVMIFGLALLYGAAQSAYLADLMTALPGMLHQPMVAIGVLLTLAGFFFKLAVFPFHFWAPDVYQGAPHQAAAYIATVSKVAAVAVLIRVAALTGGAGSFLTDALVALAIVSMTVGNLSALVQKDFKRLMAYSSIAQAGYVLIGILSMSPAGYGGAIFYALALLVMKVTCFLVLVAAAGGGRNMEIAGLAGLHRRSPILALALMMAVFSLAGIPPTIGFTGKFLVFKAAIAQGHVSLVLIAMINVVISLYFYLMVVRAAYLTEPQGPQPALLAPPLTRGLAYFLVALTVLAGIYPTPLIAWADAAARGLM